MRRIIRYIIFMVEYIQEKCRGLDFTMPCAGELTKDTSLYNGYCKTPEQHMKKILKGLPIDFSKKRFMDVGCGKGAVLKVAAGFGFEKVGGIDIDEELINIAENNMKILKYSDVECICGNAAEYENYKDYDVFFFFNLFTYEILENVLTKILESTKNYPRKIYIIYYHPVHNKLFESIGMKKINTFHDSMKGYDTYVYTHKENVEVPSGYCRADIQKVRKIPNTLWADVCGNKSRCRQ